LTYYCTETYNSRHVVLSYDPTGGIQCEQTILIAIGYFSDAVIAANAQYTTAAGNFTVGGTTAAAAAALHAASI
jgi:hypothetical protein